VNLSATDDGVEIGRKVVRGSVTEGTVVFRVDVVAKTAGPHLVIGVFRFSVTNGERLDIRGRAVRGHGHRDRLTSENIHGGTARLPTTP